MAACALGAYLTRYFRYSQGWHAFEIHQGDAMGKPSVLEVGAYLDQGHITRTRVSGKAHVIGEESLVL